MFLRSLLGPSFLALSLAYAGPSEDVTVAAMRLSDQPNYSWHTSVEDNARAYTIAGKTVRGGFTWLRLPMIDAIAVRLGRERETDIEAFFRGANACVIRVDRQWKTPEELPKHWGNTFKPDRSATFGSRGTFFDEEPATYSNAQLAASPPHVELATIVSSCSALEVDGNTVTGTLTENGACLLLVPSDDANITPLAAVGAFRLWLKDKMVVRYQLALQGVLQIGRRKVDVVQTSDTHITQVGTTSFAVPHEVRQKLGD